MGTRISLVYGPGVALELEFELRGGGAIQRIDSGWQATGDAGAAPILRPACASRLICRPWAVMYSCAGDRGMFAL